MTRVTHAIFRVPQLRDLRYCLYLVSECFVGLCLQAVAVSRVFLLAVPCSLSTPCILRMDPSGGQPGEPLQPRVITSPPPPKNTHGLDAPPATANSSFSNTQISIYPRRAGALDRPRAGSHFRVLAPYTVRQREIRKSDRLRCGHKKP